MASWSLATRRRLRHPLRVQRRLNALDWRRSQRLLDYDARGCTCVSACPMPYMVDDILLAGLLRSNLKRPCLHRKHPNYPAFYMRYLFAQTMLYTFYLTPSKTVVDM